MTAFETLRNMGLELSLEKSIAVDGLDSLAADARAKAVNLARDHKPEIIRTLEILQRQEQLQHLAELDNRIVMLTRKEGWDAQDWGLCNENRY